MKQHSIIKKGRLLLAENATEALAQTLAGKPDLEAMGFQRIKKNANRTVYHGNINGADVYLKYFHGRSLGHWLRRVLGIGDAKREMLYSHRLQTQGVASINALAADTDPKNEWILTETIAPAEPLDEWHADRVDDGPEARRQVRQAVVDMANLIGRMHRAGIIHKDLHCGNILVRTDGKKPKLVVTDLHRMSRHRRLSRRRMAKNLAQLFHDRRDFTTRTQRLRFLRTYLDAAGAPGSLRGWDWLVALFAAKHTARQHRQRDRRVMGANSYFKPLHLGQGWKAHVVLASKRKLGGSQAAYHVFKAEDWKSLLKDPDALFADGPGVTIIKNTASSQIVRRTLKISGMNVDVFIKRARGRSVLKNLLSAFRPAKGVRAFCLGHDLLTRRIATALPLAAMSRRVGPFLMDDILITEAAFAPHLYDFMDTWLSIPPKGDTELTVPQQRQLAQEVLWQLGRMLQKLHDNHFSHRDLKATNIRIRWNMGHRPEIVLIDLDGLSRVRFMTTRRKLRGLMRLNVSLLQCPPVNHSGRLRMLLGYLRRPGSGRIHFKPYWRLLETWSDKKLRQQIRSRRKRQKRRREGGEDA